MTVDRCTGITKDGKPCAAKPRPGTELCPWHTDNLAERRREWSRRGGVNSSNKARAKKQLPAQALTLHEVQGLLSFTLKATLAGKVEPGVANAVANVARTMTTVAQAGEMEARIRVLEEAAGLADRRRA